jgi:hypothetical protein
MVVSTRNTPRYPSEPSIDTEMEEAYQHLALPAPHEPEGAEQAQTLAIQPSTHHEPTLQAVSIPHHNLSDLLADIPSTVHIENLSLSIAQRTEVHEGMNV